MTTPLGIGVSLHVISLPVARAVLRGEPTADLGLPWHPDYPLTDTVMGLRLLMDAHRAAGWSGTEVPRWWSHQIVVGGVVVGDIGFHGPPDGVGSVEIGYALVRAVWGRGLATAACRQLLALAWCDGARRVVADAAIDHPASRRVLIKSGFRPVTEQAFEQTFEIAR